jgi:SAM-dependent methyltransferase
LGVSSTAVWHEVECGGYAADLPVWERLAAGAGRVLELGCGTGRVTLRLASLSKEQKLWAVDVDPSLVSALRARAADRGVSVRAVCADVCSLDLGREFELILAPMQLLQMLGSTAARRPALERVARHLSPGGRLAAALVEAASASRAGPAVALPDVRELEGWVYSSLPVASLSDHGVLEIRRLRQAVSPEGALTEEEHMDRLDALSADALESEAEALGMRPAGRLEIPPAEGYLGSTVVVLERP